MRRAALLTCACVLAGLVVVVAPAATQVMAATSPQPKPGTTAPAKTATTAPAKAATTAPVPSGSLLKPGGQWFYDHPNPDAEPLFAIACPSATICNAAGAAKIMSTGDGGSSWGEHALNQYIFGISCATVSFCAAVGIDDTVTVTANGFSNWTTTQIVPNGTASLNSVSCPSATTCYAVGTGGGIFKTANSGATWAAVQVGNANAWPQVSLNAISCLDALTCYVAGDSGTLVWTANGWASWAAYSLGFTGYLSGVSCARTAIATGTGPAQPVDSCMAVGATGFTYQLTRGGIPAGNGAVNVPTLADLQAVSCPAPYKCYATDNRGNVYIQSGAAWGVAGVQQGVTFGIACPSLQTCFAAGDYGVISATIDGGTGWTARSPGVTANLTSIRCPTASVCYALAGNRNVVKTSDGGITWADEPSVNANLYSLDSLGTLACASATSCFAFGAVSGSIIATADGGATWAPDTPNVTAQYSAADCPSATTCFALGFNNSSPHIVVATTTDSGAHWAEVTSPSATGSATGISCPVTSVCFVVTSAGVYWTTNSGSTWSSHADANLDAVSCPSTTVCLITGANKIEGTTDGGSTWTDHTPPGMAGTYTSVSCASTTTCEAVASSGPVLATSDGTSWQPLAAAPAGNNAVSCPTTSVCYLARIAGNVFGTVDSGAHWTALAPTGTTNNLASVSCPTSTACLALDTSGNVFKSTDGKRWAMSSGFVTPAPLRAIACPAAGTCFAVGSSVIAITTNGTSWTSTQQFSGESFNAIACASTNVCVAAETNGSARTTVDGGAAWSGPVTVAAGHALTGVNCPTATDCYATSDEAPGRVYAIHGATTWGLALDLATDPDAGSTVAFNAIACATAQSCFAVGNQGLSANTSDGVHWRTDSAITRANLTGVACPAASTCFASSDDSSVFETADFGQSWEPAFSGAALAMRAVSCSSASFCSAVGDGGAIGTFDGTATAWKVETPQQTTTYVRSMACPASNTCYAVGNPGTHFLKTIDGVNWTDSSLNSIDTLLGISCPTASICYAVGWPGVIYKTADSGAHWTRQANPFLDADRTFVGVSCWSALGCVVGGSDGIAMSTADGSTWRLESTGTTAIVDAVSCPSSAVCVGAGSGGQILTRSAGTWQTRTSGTTSFLDAVSCPSTSTCYAAGKAGSLLKSVDGGVSWTALTSGTSSDLFGIACLRDTVCLAVGHAGAAVITTNGTTWTSEQAVFFNSLRAVAWWDPSHVWVGGAGGTILNNNDILDICDSASIGSVPPQQIGTYITLQASAAGCADAEYKFFLQAPGGSWTAVSDWLGPTYTFVTSHLTATGVWGVGVWVREKGSNATYEAYYIGTLTLFGDNCTSAGLGATSGDGVNWQLTASSTNCGGAYRFWVLAPGGSWTPVRDYQYNNTYTWNASGLRPGIYRVGVWAQDMIIPASTYEAYAITTVAVGQCAAPAAPPDTAQPALTGTTVTFTVTPNACQGSGALYQFWVLPPGGSWTVLKSYSTSQSLAWNTSGYGAGTYQYGVWAKSTTSTAPYDNYWIGTFTLSAPVCAHAQIRTDQTSPQPSGNTITFTGSDGPTPAYSPTGCTNGDEEFWVLAPGASTWTMVQPYGSGATFAWDTTGLSPGAYRIGVWQRQVGSSSSYESYAITTFWVGT